MKNHGIQTTEMKNNGSEKNFGTYIPPPSSKDHNPHFIHCENLKYHTTIFVFLTIEIVS
jgi:hypothetical protein